MVKRTLFEVEFSFFAIVLPNKYKEKTNLVDLSTVDNVDIIYLSYFS